MYRIYENLMREMKRQGWTRRELAKRLGMKESTLGFKLRGESAWKLREMRQVQAVLELGHEGPERLTLDELFWENEGSWTE